MTETVSQERTFPVSDFDQIKQKVLKWAQPFSTFCFMDNHHYHIQPQTVECLMAAGIKRKYKPAEAKAFDGLQAFIDQKQSWLFGHFGYDLKNEIEDLSSAHEDHIGFPGLFLFEPEIIIRLSQSEITIIASDPAKVFKEIGLSEIDTDDNEHTGEINIRSRFSKEEYTDTIGRLRKHILRGDCYEINFCHEFFSENTLINPLAVYKKLSNISPNPFSALYKLDGQWLLCASPERFLKKSGRRLLSQPIKGTSRRIPSSIIADEHNKHELQESAKDRSENVMVVDLVRNDLARICEEGSVQVDELYGVYSFPQVHQMISTISGIARNDISFTDIIKATFPMGSMTGAPKKKVMELIEQYERTRRGIFAGALGYISPDGDFDFNVVIRSIMYNAVTGYLSFQAGSGITFYSDAEKEWEECLMKAEAMRTVLESGTSKNNESD